MIINSEFILTKNYHSQKNIAIIRVPTDKKMLFNLIVRKNYLTSLNKLMFNEDLFGVK